MLDDSQIDEQNDGFEGGSEGAPEDGLEPASPAGGPKPPLNQANKNQKIAVAGLAVFAVLIVVLWSVQLKNNIYGPFNANLTGANESAQISDQTASDLALKNKDTDGDGLNDYDELNFYKTSPYLADSDSDGLPDGVEVKNGTDPNCPTGRICAGSEFNGNGAASGTPADTLNNLSSQSEALNSMLNQYNTANQPANSAGGSTSQPANSAGGSAGSLTAEQKQALQGIDAATLRQLLLQNGMDKATLDQISDTELMQSYNETLQ